MKTGFYFCFCCVLVSPLATGHLYTLCTQFPEIIRDYHVSYDQNKIMRLECCERQSCALQGNKLPYQVKWNPENHTSWTTTLYENQEHKQREVEVLVWMGAEHRHGKRNFQRKPTGLNLNSILKKGANINCIRQKYFHCLGTVGLRVGRGQLCCPGLIKEVCLYMRWSGLAHIHLQHCRGEKVGDGGWIQGGWESWESKQTEISVLHMQNSVDIFKIPSLQLDGVVEGWIITPCFLDEETEKPHS